MGQSKLLYKGAGRPSSAVALSSLSMRRFTALVKLALVRKHWLIRSGRNDSAVLENRVSVSLIKGPKAVATT